MYARRDKIVVAMSGGVDSSVAAALLKQAGHQVTGITMQICPPPRGILDSVEDARKVADTLDIPHLIMDFSDVYAQKVIPEFCEEYSSGRTPNPCVRCNQYIKFGILHEKARELGADYIATGHHTRIEKDETKGLYLLKKGIDQGKDQSYFLYTLTQEQLRHSLFPIGNFTKDKVREIARELGLPVATKPGSQEICFIPEGDYANFLKDYIPRAAEPGPILDEQGSVLGSHRGIMSYTIGQRKGLGISAKEPLYVIAIEPRRNAIVVGSKDRILGDELIASRLNWIAITKPAQPITVKAKIRYRHQEAEATVKPIDESRVSIKFKEPQMAITPGQATVFYDGDIVLGGGTIESAGKPTTISG